MSNCSVESWGNKVVYIQRSPVSFSNTNQLSVINRQLVKVSERQTLAKFALDFQRNYIYIYINRLKIIQAISRSSFSVASYDSFHLLVGENYFHFYVCSALISLALDNGIKQTISGKK